MKSLFLTSAAVLSLATPAAAATLSVSGYSSGAYDAAIAGFSSAVIEDFESYAEMNVADGFSTSVGSFSTLGGTGTGGTVTNAGFANDGTQLAVRDGNVFGRKSTTNGGSKFLDSNDTYGIRWDVSLGGGMFDKLVLTLTDAADVGATMFIMAEGLVTTVSALGDGVTKLVEIDFGMQRDSATVFFSNYRNGGQVANDGFSLDDVAVNAVPVPASALLLLGGLGGLAAMRRRKKS